MNPTSGSGTSGFFDATARYPAGPGNGDFFLISIGGWTPGCVVHIRPNDNIMYILNDAGTGWQQPTTLGSAVYLENSVCKAWAGGSGKQIWYQPNGWYERAYASLEFKPGFSGSNPTWAGVYTYSGASNSTSGWVTTGTWTVPTMQTTGTGARMTHEAANHPISTNDMLSGQPMLMPSSYSPDTAINLSTASEDNPTSLAAGSTYSVSIRYAKPNTQVFARVILNEVQPTALLAYKPDPNGDVNQGIAGNDDALASVGWYMGVTDSTGYFIFSAKIPISSAGAFYGGNSVQIHIGNIANGQNYSVTPYLALTGDTYIGGVDFWSYNASTGTPTLPTYYSIRKGIRILAQGKRADNFNVGRATSTWQKVGETWNYALTLDTTKADSIRVSRISGWEGEIGPDNLNFRRQNGWQGSQGWTHDDPSGARGPATKFDLISEWMPGPVSLYFVTDDTAEPFVMQDSEREDRALADAGGIFHNSVRRHVIGPAIPPDVDMKGLSALIRNWVDEGNHFLKPLVGVDIDLREAVGKLTGLKDGYETNVVDCIKAALEVAK